MFDTPLRDLPVDRFIHFPLSTANSFHNFGTASNDVQRSPREKRRHRIQVRSVCFTSDPDRLKGYTATTAESITNPRNVSELALT